MIKFLPRCIFGYNGGMSEALRIWLSQQLDQRGWSHRELARQTGFSQALVSKTLSGERNPSANFCTTIAQVFETSPETILRLAGILPAITPAQPSDDSTLQEIVELVRNLSDEQRVEALRYIRYLYQQNNN